MFWNSWVIFINFALIFYRFDILIDEKLKPWLLEINYTPSFHTGSELDHKIKCGVVADALKLIDVSERNKY